MPQNRAANAADRDDAPLPGPPYTPFTTTDLAAVARFGLTPEIMADPSLIDDDTEENTMTKTRYLVCNRLLDPETNEYCEFDGDVDVTGNGWVLCPGCNGVLIGRGGSR